MIRHRLLAGMLGLASLVLVALAAWPTSAALAQTGASFPSRPVKLIVPFAPGGPTDTVARLMAEQLQAQWKQPVVVDYKPGAGTVVGTQFVARSTPDGYTLGMAISAHMINPALQANLPYETTKDIAGVSLIGQAHFGLFANPATPYNTVSELIAYAKANPGTLSYATPGNGTGTHLAGEMLKHLAGIDIAHVPYKGSSPAQVDVVGGRVPLLFDVLFSSMPMVRDGKLKLIALSSPERARSMPQAPLIAETLPGFSAMSLIGIIAPAGISPALMQQISADISTAVKAPGVVERMAQLGMEPVGSTQQAYDQIIRTEIEKWMRVVKTAGIRLE